MKSPKKTVGYNLMRMRRGYGLRQRDFAKLLGIHLNTYQKLEAGKSFPQEATVKQITEALSLDEEELFREAAAPLPPAEQMAEVAAEKAMLKILSLNETHRELLSLLPKLGADDIDRLVQFAKVYAAANARRRHKPELVHGKQKKISKE